MIKDSRVAVLDALTLLETRDQPAPLMPLARRIADLGEASLSDYDLESMLCNASPGDSLVVKLGRLLAKWDSDQSGDWRASTPPNSSARRDCIYRELGLDNDVCVVISKLRPIVSGDLTVVSEEFERWFSSSLLAERSFYWPNYRSYLQFHRGWSSQTIDSLDLASDQIVERLANPVSITPHAKRGLVVGYVQSGKTANISAVISKAVDVGYRFIIVLTGMHEALRRQTQRRLDMEVLGKPNILENASELEAYGSPRGDYLGDPSWLSGEFSDLGGSRPSPEIIRLTSLFEDFNQHKTHALLFKPISMAGRLYEAHNLFGTPVRLAVVKKNSHVLAHLRRAMRANSPSMAEIPSLIIDDESDQASVNTTKPTWRTSTDREALIVQRKKINEAISEILLMMPRSQYIGYTATPFANVFVDPEDADDIFPRDFIVALPEPEGYMGASSFFNSVQPSVPKYELSNKEAYVRLLAASDDDQDTQTDELRGAIASYVVAGAIKLYRQSKDPQLARNYRHHTMLVHEAAQKAKHREIENRIVSIWADADWGARSGRETLLRSFEDMRRTLEDMADASAPFVDNFEAIESFIPTVIERVERSQTRLSRSSRNVALVVNSDTEIEEKLDFDRHSTWKIIVGGAMLSRGFTIEGLTVSYFRRSPKAHDTLLQMGRWFGYRPGYRDLVRIYLAANTAISKSQFVNLYDAFDSMAETEAEFREQLGIYASWDGDKPGITPRQVVPLVQQSLPWLKPTAPNKMYNARIVSQREAIFSPKGLAWERSLVAANWSVMVPIVRAADTHVDLYRELPTERHVPAWLGLVSVNALVESLRNVQYLEDYALRVVAPKLTYYQRSFEKGTLVDFLVLFPQLMQERSIARAVEVPGLGARTLATRTRNKVTDYYGEFTDPAHRHAADGFLGMRDKPFPPELKDFIEGGRRGVVLAYLIPELGQKPQKHDPSPEIYTPEDCSVGLSIYLSDAALDPANGQRITWQVAE